MYDVEGLEKEWKRYRRKRQIPFVVTAVLLLIALLYLLFRSDLQDLFPKRQAEQNQSNGSETVLVKAKKRGLKPYVPSIAAEKEDRLSAKAVPTATPDDRNRTSESGKPAPVPSMSIEVSEADAAESKAQKRKHMKIILTDRYPQKDTGHTAVKKKSPALSIRRVKKSFATSRSYKDSLYLANAYYRKGNYAEAEKWALITNDLNSKVEESWLIFAKAKARSGDRREALRILSSYVEKTNSSRAKRVLQRIRRGSI